MAIENRSLFNGQIMTEPAICTDDEGKKTKASFLLNVVHGIRMGPNHIVNERYNTLYVITKIPEQIDYFETLRKGDMVEIQGVLTSQKMLKVMSCNHCGESLSREGYFTYIQPIFIERREPQVSEDEAMQILKGRCEVSNDVSVIGIAAKDPIFGKNNKGYTVCRYPVVLKRKFRIKEDDVRIKTDYIWVKSYGKQAEHDILFVKQGTKILVVGNMQCRTFSKSMELCPICGHEFSYRDVAMEIVPYYTEYLSNFRSEEEREKFKQECSIEFLDRKEELNYDLNMITEIEGGVEDA